MTPDFDDPWKRQFHHRLADFRATVLPAKGLPCSIKLRSSPGGFDRTNSPRTFALIDQSIPTTLTAQHWLQDHSTGPEILTFAGPRITDLTVDAQVVTLLARLVAANVEGIRLGDPRQDYWELLVRGFDEHEAYFELAIFLSRNAADFSETNLATVLRQGGVGIRSSRPFHPAKPTSDRPGSARHS